ncbi:hypothetical protein ACWGI1_00220 [Streptomyces sp. NPDC054835]|uniref:hypothetical protein n=1 Tax=Streptomyces exfoliatus TaxID=1905 RepID=UPI0004670A9C|nr:hypothetical protein [Streptomyces exfoliatus]
MSATAGQTVVLARDPATDLITASGGDGLAHGILERTFFLRETRGITWHRLSPTVPPEDERTVARVAVARLQAAGYRVLADEEFAWDGTEARYVTTGRAIENLAGRIREAASVDELDYELGELTATHDGILASLGLVLHAVADAYDRFSGPADPRWGARLRSSSEHELRLIAAELRSVRTNLADRSAPPGRRGPHLPPPAPPAPPTSTASGRTQ